MSSVVIKTGELLPLHLQLTDYDVAKYPRAYLFTDTGTPIGSPVDLAHVSDGLYTNKSVAMPAGNVLAQYKVFDDAGHTTISNNDAGLDIFILDTFVPALNFEILTGVLYDSPLAGELEDAELVGALIADNIAGAFDASDLDANLADDVIVGEIEGCL